MKIIDASFIINDAIHILKDGQLIPSSQTVGQFQGIHPRLTYLAILDDDSMSGERYFSGDGVFIDCSLEERHEDTVLAIIDGEFMLRQLFIENREITLRSANLEYPRVYSRKYNSIEILGVLTHVMRIFR